jgi:hypothetical protein
MPRLSQGTLALAGLAAFAIWLFAVLPFLYGPPPRFAETSSPPQAHSEQTEQQPAAKPDGSVNAPFFIRIPKTAKEEAEEAGDRREKSSTDRWLMIFTGAVALFTLLLVGATVMLYFAGEKQLRLAREAGKRQSDEMQKSIAVAERAAKAAESAGNIAERSIELSESASLTADMWTIENWGTLQPTVKFHIYNSGRNTAEIIDIVCRVPIGDELPATPNYGDAPKSPPAFVAPGGRNLTEIKPTTTPEQVAAIETGTINLFVYGRITFKTVSFNNIWELGFAQRVTFPANSQGSRVANFSYPVAPGFNFLRPKGEE